MKQNSKPEPGSESEIRPEQGTPSEAMVVGLIALLTLIWSSTWLVIKQGLSDLPPLGSAALRFGVAGLVFTAIAPRLSRLEGGQRPNASLALTHGLLTFGVNYGIVYYVETGLPSGVVSLLWAVYPLLMAIVGHHLLPGERLVRTQWLGLAVGLGGLVVLFGADLERIGPGATTLAAILMLSPISVVVSSTVIRLRGRSVSSVLLNRDGMLIGAVALAAASAALEAPQSFNLTLRAAGSVLYLALVGTVFALGLYFWMLRYVPAYRLGVTTYLCPAFALALGSSVGGEGLAASTVLGAVLVLTGAVFVLRHGKRSAAPTDETQPAPVVE